MWIPKFNLSSSSIRHPILILFIGAALLLIRAWPRLLNPEIWDEDGTKNIPGFLQNGFADIFEPVNGYLILVPKLITMLAASISISQYPLISTLIAWGVTLAAFYVIASAPLYLSGGILLAAASLLIPSDPEVFGLPLYIFWWVSLLLFIIVFWDKLSTDWAGRTIIIFFASLSSPVCLVVLPLIWVRAWLLRKKLLEIGLAVFASFCAAVQLWVMWHYPGGAVVSSAGNINYTAFLQVIPKFLGAYLISNLQSGWQWQFGIVLLAFFVATIFRNRHSWVLWALVYLWCVAVLMSISRVNIEIIHQALAGPRYFFYPFIFQSWFLLQIAFADSSRCVRCGAWLFLLFSVLNALPVLDRKHDDLNWKLHLDSCRQFDHYNLPVHYNGNAALSWNLPMTGQKCAELLAHDSFYRQVGIKSLPYKIIGKSTNDIVTGKIPSLDAVVKSEWSGQDYNSSVAGFSTLPGWRVMGSYLHSEAEAGELILHLHRGEQIWFRSESKSQKQRIIIDGSNGKYIDALPATSEWVLLEFSNVSLPDEFNVKFVDGGDGWGEWSSVALIDN
jgi:hypothetical protein